MFSDPQSVTINAVAQSLPRLTTGDHTATYTKDDESVSMIINHQSSSKGRVRRMVRLDLNKFATDPFVPSTNRKVNHSVFLVLDEPKDGAYSNAELLLNCKALVGWLTDANLTKFIAGES